MYACVCRSMRCVFRYVRGGMRYACLNVCTQEYEVCELCYHGMQASGKKYLRRSLTFCLPCLRPLIFNLMRIEKNQHSFVWIVKYQHSIMRTERYQHSIMRKEKYQDSIMWIEKYEDDIIRTDNHEDAIMQTEYREEFVSHIWLSSFRCSFHGQRIVIVKSELLICCNVLGPTVMDIESRGSCIAGAADNFPFQFMRIENHIVNIEGKGYRKTFEMTKSLNGIIVGE